MFTSLSSKEFICNVFNRFAIGQTNVASNRNIWYERTTPFLIFFPKPHRLSEQNQIRPVKLNEIFGRHPNIHNLRGCTHVLQIFFLGGGTGGKV